MSNLFAYLTIMFPAFLFAFLLFLENFGTCHCRLLPRPPSRPLQWCHIAQTQIAPISPPLLLTMSRFSQRALFHTWLRISPRSWNRGIPTSTNNFVGFPSIFRVHCAWALAFSAVCHCFIFFLHALVFHFVVLGFCAGFSRRLWKVVH